MTEIPPATRRQAEAVMAGPAAAFLERLAEKLGSTASVSTIFGKPVACDRITIIPVAKVSLGFGGGAGEGKNDTEVSWGSGGGGGASAVPIGYIEIKDGNAAFKPIRDPLTDILIPLAALIAGSAAPRIVRKLMRSRRGKA